MSWYRTGTVTVTNNSTAVTGSGTAWVDAAQVGESFLGPDGQVYEITAINSATSLTIAPAYKGSTASAQAYALMPTQGYLRDLAAQAAALVNSYAAVRDNAGQGKFAAGTVTAPSLRGVSDDNTGVNLPGGDVLQLVTGGANGQILLTNAMPADWPGGWKAVDNSYVPITTVEDWRAFYAAMYDHGMANFAHAQALKAQLEAAETYEEVQAIHWPAP